MLINQKRAYYLVAAAGFMGALLLFTVWRLATFQDPRIHYHANFALFVNGVEDEFSDDSFYEEVSACDPSQHDNPKSRVHLHDHKSHAIHVHDRAATWGHLFANLGYGLSNNSLRTDAGVFMDKQDGKRLHFYLNGKEEKSIANRVINNEDALLVSYGDETADVLKSRYEQIVKDAADYNKRNDPSSCTGAKSLTLTQKLSDIFGIKRVE